MEKYENTKTFFLKATLQIGLKKYLLLKKLKITCVINDLNGEEITGTFYEKELQKANQVFKRKGDKIYVKWKGYDNSFNSWIDKASLVQRTQ